jgi:16S rRNA (cytidine1402-2'-O)-methyltransferase
MGSSSPGKRVREPNGSPARSKPDIARTDAADATAETGAEDEGRTKALAPGLHIVATPIGNLGDITLRALAALRGADRIVCEDTRVTARLLQAYGIARPMIPYHEHNAERVRPRLLAALAAGERLALVSDAGTPLVSDPGYKLVRAALAAGIPVTTAPGASAVLAALALSGLPTDRFLFAGFLPPKSGPRQSALRELAAVPASLVLFETAPRLAASLADMAAILGPREAALCRELTKRYEEVRRAPLEALAEHYAAEGPPRGEIVLVIAPPAAEAALPEAELDRQLTVALGQGSLSDAVALVTGETGLPRRRVYGRALALAKKASEG